MTKIHFGDVVVLLGDSDKGSRSAIREILFERGCRDFRLGATVAEIGAALGKGPADIVICGSRRNRFILRLLVARVSHLFDGRGGWGRQIRRDFLNGFDRYLVQLLGRTLYNQLNDEARDILRAPLKILLFRALSI